MNKKLWKLFVALAILLHYQTSFAQVPCQPSVVFSTAAYNTIGGVYPFATLPHPVFPTGKYHLTSNLVVASNLTITGATILIEPGISITVNSNAKLILDNCHLFTCPTDNKVWQGIVLASGGGTSGRIELRNNTLIEDANTGISAINPITPAPGDYIIKSTGAIFNRCGYGINITNYQPASPAIYPIQIENTVFTSRQLSVFAGYPMAWPTAASLKVETSIAAATPPLSIESYALAARKDNSLSLFGIILERVGYTNPAGTVFADVQIGNPAGDAQRNLFDNTSDGIKAINTNLLAYNNWFIRMAPLPGTYFALPSPARFYKPQGCGIDFVSDDATPPGGSVYKSRIRVLGFPANQTPTAQNRFYDCRWGIYLDAFWTAELSYSHFQTSNTTAYNIDPKSKLPNTPIGIYAFGSIYQQLNVVSNKMYNTSVGAMMTTRSYSFIGAPTARPGNINIQNNVIVAAPPAPVSFSAAYYVYQGINVMTTPLAALPAKVSATANITNNYLHNVYNGIAVSNQKLQKCYTTGNTVNLRNLGSDVQKGITYENTNDGQISGNIVSGMDAPILNKDKANGIYCANSLSTKVCDNTSQYLGRGFNFANAVAQTGTRWTNNTMRSNLKGFVLGSDIGFQSVIVKGIPPRSYTYACANVWDGAWGANYQTYVENSTDVLNNRLLVRTSITNENPTNHSALPLFYKYWNSGSRQSIWPATTPAACYDVSYFSVISSPMAYAILADTMGYDSTRRPQQWLAQWSLYQAGLADSSLADSSAAFAQLMSSAAGSRYAWLGAIEAALGNADYTLAQSLIDAPVAALGRQVIDSSLVITDYAEANYIVAKQVQWYQLCIRYAQGSLSAADSAAIADIAALCPAHYGGIVQEARALQAQLVEHFVVYDDQDCMATPPPPRIVPHIDVATAMSYTLYPNPNEGSFVLQQSWVQDGFVPIKIYDLVGSLVLNVKLNFTQGKAHIQLPQPISGLYLVVIGDAASNNQYIKFTIK